MPLTWEIREKQGTPHIFAHLAKIDTPLSVIEVDYTYICALLGHHWQAVDRGRIPQGGATMTVHYPAGKHRRCFKISSSAALRYILRHCGVRESTPHSSGFARLASNHF
jgi:hypothetical protein